MTPLNPYDVEVGRHLRSLRLKYMLKQDDVAQRLGVQKAAIARWENGSRGMSAATLLALADLFGVAGYQLLPPTHQPPPALAASAPPAPPDDPIAKIAALLHSRPDLVPAVLDTILAQIGFPAHPAMDDPPGNTAPAANATSGA